MVDIVARFNTHGFPCIIVRVPRLGHLCGYIAVPPGHPWHGGDYDDLAVPVHGGLTFAEPSPGRLFSDGEFPDGWWIQGFDCAHAGDLVPGSSSSGVFRDEAYVRGECESLAAQALTAALVGRPVTDAAQHEKNLRDAVAAAVHELRNALVPVVSSTINPAGFKRAAQRGLDVATNLARALEPTGGAP